MTFAIAAFGPVITYVFEITGSEYRAQVTSLMTGLPWAVGQAYVAFLAQMTRHWQWAMVTLVAIAAPFPLMYYFFVPESYVFLCSKEGLLIRSKPLSSETFFGKNIFRREF